MYREVVIFYSGDDVNDEEFAQHLKVKISSFAEPYLMDVDQLERDDRAGLPRPDEFEGAPIYIISPSLLRNPAHREKLLASMPGPTTPGRNISWRPSFYICHDITFGEIEQNYPELEDLVADVLLGSEEHLDDLIEDLRQYLADVSRPDNPAERTRRRSYMVYIAIPVYLLGNVGAFLYSLSFISSIWLLSVLVLKVDPPAFEAALICHVFFAAGYSFSRIPSLDLWEYLGPAWKVSDDPEESDRSLYWNSGHPDSEYTESIHRKTVFKWMSAARAAQFRQLLTLGSLLVPGILFVKGTNLVGAGTIAFLIGLFMPMLRSVSLRYLENMLAWGYGMSDYEIKRIQQTFGDSRPPAGASRRTVHRPWLPRSPWIYGALWMPALQAKVFISHAWDDDKCIEAAGRKSPALVLYDIVTDLHLSCFVDKKEMTSKFANLRSELASELLSSTHFFVVLGPNVKRSKPVHREIRTAMQRRYTGLEPAIICIVEPEVAEELMKNETASEINFLLRTCPKLTYAEASDPQVIRHIIRQRCRQGLLQDWLALISPASALRGYLANETRSMTRR